MSGSHVPPSSRSQKSNLLLSGGLRSVETVAGFIWNQRATGWLLLSGLVVACIAFWIWPQPAGYAVTILGGAVAVMTLRQMKHTQKFLLTLTIFALMGIELKDIRKDRIKSDGDQATALKENRDGFASIADGLKNAIVDSQRQFAATMMRSDAIINKTSEAAAYISGGDTFPIVFPGVVTQADGTNEIGFYLGKHGKYPLYEIVIFVGRPYRTSADSNQTRAKGASFKLAEYNTSTNYPILFQPLPQEAVAYYSASMSDRNGNWEEVIEARKVESRTFFRWVLFGAASPGVTPSKQLLDLADSGFPVSARHDSIYPLNLKLLPYEPSPSAKPTSRQVP